MNQPPTPMKRHFGGKAAHQRRKDRRAAMQNIGFNDRLDAAFNAKYFSGLRPFYVHAQKIADAVPIEDRDFKDPAEIYISITTRGFGFHITDLHPDSSKSLDAIRHYRISLLQLNNKLLKIAKSKNLSIPGLVTINQSIPKENLGIISFIIDSCCLYNRYIPSVIPVPKISQFTTWPERLYVSKEIDPYRVTIGNLRDIVIKLSDKNYSIEERKRFVEHNPIPCCSFSDEYLLLNRDEIMPENYSANELGLDIISFYETMRLCRTQGHDVLALEEKISGLPHFVRCVRHDKRVAKDVDGNDYVQPKPPFVSAGYVYDKRMRVDEHFAALVLYLGEDRSETWIKATCYSLSKWSVSDIPRIADKIRVEDN